MIVWSLFIIDLMGLFFYTKIGSIISIGDLPTTNIIEPIEELLTKKLHTLGVHRANGASFDIEFLVFQDNFM